MKWKILMVLSAVAGGIAVAAHRRNAKTLADAALWAAATDPVMRFGSE